MGSSPAPQINTIPARICVNLGAAVYLGVVDSQGTFYVIIMTTKLRIRIGRRFGPGKGFGYITYQKCIQKPGG